MAEDIILGTVEFIFQSLAIYVFWNWGLNHFLHMQHMDFGEATAFAIGTTLLIWKPIREIVKKGQKIVYVSR